MPTAQTSERSASASSKEVNDLLNEIQNCGFECGEAQFPLTDEYDLLLKRIAVAKGKILAMLSGERGADETTAPQATHECLGWLPWHPVEGFDTQSELSSGGQPTNELNPGWMWTQVWAEVPHLSEKA